MGYADWHFLMKDFEKNPKGFLIGFLIIVLLAGGGYLLFSFQKYRANKKEATQFVPYETHFIGIAKKNLTGEEIKQAKKNKQMKKIYDKLDSILPMNAKELQGPYNRYSDEYTNSVIEAFQKMKKNYEMFLALEDNDFTNLRMKKCLDTQGKIKKYIKNPYFKTIEAIENGKINDIKAIDLPPISKLISTNECANFK